MKIADLFPRKSASKKDRGGLTQAQADAIEKEFAALIEPVAEQADIYFRRFSINGKERYWLLQTESHLDLDTERKKYVLKYGAFFVNEIRKVEPDEIPYSWPESK